MTRERIEINNATETLVTGVDKGHSWVRYARKLDHTAAAVWGVVGDVGNLESMANFITEIEVEGKGAGAVRRMRLSDALGGEWITERIDAHCDRKMSYSYSFVDFGSLPWGHYAGKLSVFGAGPGQSIFYFESDELPLGVSHEEAAQISVSNIRGYMDQILKCLQKADNT